MEEWWSAYDEIEDPDAIRKDIEAFMQDHTDLFEYLYINEDVVFDLGPKFRREGRQGDFVSFLLDYKTRFPNLYAEREDIFNLDIIYWLIGTGKSQAIHPYFAPYSANPDLHADILMDLVDLLIAKDVTESLLSLVKQTKEQVLQSDEFLDGNSILVLLIHDKLAPYIREDYSSADISNFLEEFAALYPMEITEKLFQAWSSRFKDILRPFGRWEVDPKWNSIKGRLFIIR